MAGRKAVASGNTSTRRQNVVKPSAKAAAAAASTGSTGSNQRAVPRSVSTAGSALTSPTSPSLPSAPAPDPKMSRTESAKFAVDARWAGEKASEQEVFDHFFALSTDDAVQLLGKMRFNCEVAARGINAAIEKNKKEDKCYVCEGPKPPNKQWAFIRAVKHPVTHSMYNIFFCSTACVSRENIRNQGPAGANHLR
jgi:hypothetical protein